MESGLPSPWSQPGRPSQRALPGQLIAGELLAVHYGFRIAFLTVSTRLSKLFAFAKVAIRAAVEPASE
jgi:hypothetical protein